jgi:hypothetical protein
VSKLRNLKDVLDGEDRMDVFPNALQAEAEKGNDTLNSKLRKVWKNPDLVLAIMECILIMGSHYQHHQKLTVNWLASYMDVVMGVSGIYSCVSVLTYGRCIKNTCRDTANCFGYEYCPIRLAQHSRKCTNSSQMSMSLDTQQKLLNTQKNILMLDKGTPTIFTSFLEEVHVVAVKCFQAYKGVLGSCDEEYL